MQTILRKCPSLNELPCCAKKRTNVHQRIICHIPLGIFISSQGRGSAWKIFWASHPISVAVTWRRKRSLCGTKKASKMGAWEASTEANCISEYFSRSPAGLLRLFVTRWSNSLALDRSLYFFVIVIALTKAGTSEVVAADQMREMQMVRAQRPAQARTNKVYPPWVW